MTGSKIAMIIALLWVGSCDICDICDGGSAIYADAPRAELHADERSLAGGIRPGS